MLFEDVNQLLKPGYMPIETGYYQLPSGHIHVAVLTRMPGSKGRMVDWWFEYHLDSAAYEMWRLKPPETLKSIKRNKQGSYIGTNQILLEDPDQGDIKLRVHFHDPSEFLDVSRFEETHTGAAICANVYNFEKVPLGRTIHFVRDTDFGCEMRSRFWLYQASEIEGRHLMQHCIERMGYLADLLPELYKSEAPDR
ncbi:MAG: hypothetical protein JW932_13880 [Deltaproteobacteria bacterium]|nr:hypothetical protein [Deltaproteobacteria bacterium]